MIFDLIVIIQIDPDQSITNNEEYEMLKIKWGKMFCFFFK